MRQQKAVIACRRFGLKADLCQAFDHDLPKNAAKHGAKQPRDHALQQEQPLDVAFGEAKRFQDGDVACFFEHHGRDDVVDTESRNQ